MTIDEMHCLCALFSERPPSVSRLSELINVSPTRASKILKDLEQNGLVSRRADAADRRREQVALTESGGQAAVRILSLFQEVGTELLGGWRPELPTEFAWIARMCARREEGPRNV